MSERRVLYVDDDPRFLEHGRRLATEGAWGFGLSTAESGRKALELLRDRRVDCIVSESLRGPDGDPFVVTARRRSPRVPIVLASTDPWSAVSRTVRSAAVSEFVRKCGPSGLETAFDRAASLVRRADDGTDADGASTSEWRVVETYDPTEVDDVAVALTAAVETLVGPQVTEETPLFERIDTDALQGVFDSASSRSARTAMQVRFRYGEFELLVEGDGTIAARAVAD